MEKITITIPTEITINTSWIQELFPGLITGYMLFGIISVALIERAEIQNRNSHSEIFGVKVYLLVLFLSAFLWPLFLQWEGEILAEKSNKIDELEEAN